MNKIIIVHYEEDPAAIEEFTARVSKLWHEHVNYTRNAIISILAGLEDIDAVGTRLMKNQEDIGNLISPYYGEEAGTKLTDLLKEHIAIAGDIFKTLKDSRSTADLEAKWVTNADAIATFMNEADPDNWPKDAVSTILRDHLSCTLKEATARARKEWTADIAAFDECQDQIVFLSDAISKGILSKFPETFVIQRSSQIIKKK